MNMAAFRKNYVKMTLNGVPYKKQPILPVVKFEKLLRTQKIIFNRAENKNYTVFVY